MLFIGIYNIQSNEVLMQVKEDIIRQNKQNRPIRWIAETSRVAKSTMSYILKKMSCTGKRP